MPAAAAAPVAARCRRSCQCPRQTHQRRFPTGGLDPAGQHHDAGAGAATTPSTPRPRPLSPPSSSPALTNAPCRPPRPTPALAAAKKASRAQANAAAASAGRWHRRRRLPQRLRTDCREPSADECWILPKPALIVKPSPHAASSHQACRRLRIRQGTQGLGRGAHADREAKGPAAASYSHHPDDAEARRGIARGRVALLGDPGRDRGAGKNYRASSRSATATASDDAGW